jgi:hypothetical protein
VNINKITGENQEIKKYIYIKKKAGIPLLFPKKVLYVKFINGITDKI